MNLAAVHGDDIKNKTEYQRTNVGGAENVSKVCSEKKIYTLVFKSTVAVYGFAELGTDETGKIAPFNEYGRTKFLAEGILRAWQTKADNLLIIFRPTVIFGKDNRRNVFNLLSQIASVKFLMIGNGKNKKSMAYIANVVTFWEHALSVKVSMACLITPLNLI